MVTLKPDYTFGELGGIDDLASLGIEIHDDAPSGQEERSRDRFPGNGPEDAPVRDPAKAKQLRETLSRWKADQVNKLVAVNPDAVERDRAVAAEHAPELLSEYDAVVALNEEIPGRIKERLEGRARGLPQAKLGKYGQRSVWWAEVDPLTHRWVVPAREEHGVVSGDLVVGEYNGALRAAVVDKPEDIPDGILLDAGSDQVLGNRVGRVLQQFDQPYRELTRRHESGELRQEWEAREAVSGNGLPEPSAAPAAADSMSETVSAGTDAAPTPATATVQVIESPGARRESNKVRWRRIGEEHGLSDFDNRSDEELEAAIASAQAAIDAGQYDTGHPGDRINLLGLINAAKHTLNTRGETKPEYAGEPQSDSMEIAQATVRDPDTGETVILTAAKEGDGPTVVTAESEGGAGPLMAATEAALVDVAERSAAPDSAPADEPAGFEPLPEGYDLSAYGFGDNQDDAPEPAPEPDKYELANQHGETLADQSGHERGSDEWREVASEGYNAYLDELDGIERPKIVWETRKIVPTETGYAVVEPAPSDPPAVEDQGIEPLPEGGQAVVDPQPSEYETPQSVGDPTPADVVQTDIDGDGDIDRVAIDSDGDGLVDTVEWKVDESSAEPGPAAASEGAGFEPLPEDYDLSAYGFGDKDDEPSAAADAATAEGSAAVDVDDTQTRQQWAAGILEDQRFEQGLTARQAEYSGNLISRVGAGMDAPWVNRQEIAREYVESLIGPPDAAKGEKYSFRKQQELQRKLQALAAEGQETTPTPDESPESQDTAPEKPETESDETTPASIPAEASESEPEAPLAPVLADAEPGPAEPPPVITPTTGKGPAEPPQVASVSRNDTAEQLQQKWRQADKSIDAYAKSYGITGIPDDAARLELRPDGSIGIERLRVTPQGGAYRTPAPTPSGATGGGGGGGGGSAKPSAPSITLRKSWDRMSMDEKQAVIDVINDALARRALLSSALVTMTCSPTGDLSLGSGQKMATIVGSCAPRTSPVAPQQSLREHPWLSKHELATFGGGKRKGAQSQKGKKPKSRR